MRTSQQIIESRFFLRASAGLRLKCTLTALVLAGLWVIFFLGATGRLGIGQWFGPCGFKQNHDLPCPTCGMTTSAQYFAQGRVFKSFYTQPAAAFICGIFAITLFFTLFTAVFGIYFKFSGGFLAGIKIKYVILIFIIVILSGWAVTLARAIAEKGQY